MTVATRLMSPISTLCVFVTRYFRTLAVFEGEKLNQSERRQTVTVELRGLL